MEGEREDTTLPLTAPFCSPSFPLGTPLGTQAGASLHSFCEVWSKTEDENQFLDVGLFFSAFPAYSVNTKECSSAWRLFYFYSIITLVSVQWLRGIFQSLFRSLLMRYLANFHSVFFFRFFFKYFSF